MPMQFTTCVMPASRSVCRSLATAAPPTQSPGATCAADDGRRCTAAQGFDGVHSPGVRLIAFHDASAARNPPGPEVSGQRLCSWPAAVHCLRLKHAEAGAREFATT